MSHYQEKAEALKQIAELMTKHELTGASVDAYWHALHLPRDAADTSADCGEEQTIEGELEIQLDADLDEAQDFVQAHYEEVQAAAIALGFIKERT